MMVEPHRSNHAKEWGWNDGRRLIYVAPKDQREEPMAPGSQSTMGVFGALGEGYCSTGQDPPTGLCRRL